MSTHPETPLDRALTPALEARPRRILRRVLTALGLVVSLTLLLFWLPPESRELLIVSLIANRVLVGLLVGFGLVAVSLLWAVGQRLDLWLLTALNVRGRHSVRIDRLMWLASQIGSARLTTGLVLSSYVLGRRHFAVELALGSITLSLLVTILKILSDRPRPFIQVQETRVVGNREWGLSFPSGHTAQAFFLMSAIARYLELPPGAALALYVVAGLVGYTRVFLGVHFPRDVIAGATLGLIWGGLATLIVPILL